MKTTSVRLASLAGATLCAGLLTAGPAFGHAVNGAIYTSTADHSAVNANQYDSKEDVYLNGGPSNFPVCNGGKLTDGDYYFQVTTPDGDLLSNSDTIFDRAFRVTGGVISDNLGTHLSGGTSPCGSLAIQLFPYDDTDNNGGVYKVWITPQSDFEDACGIGIDCGADGFVPGHTKTDNFKVAESIVPDPDPEFGALEAIKFYDADADGVCAVGDEALEGWLMTATSVNQAVDSSKLTDDTGTAFWDDLVPDTDYFVEEGTPVEGNWVHSGTIYDGHDGSAQNPAGPLEVEAGATTSVIFCNYCTVPSGGKTIGFWSNKNGGKAFNNIAGAVGILAALHLVDANGDDFDPANHAALSSWLLNANAVNMAYMLSAQLAAMVLNVEAGFVDGNAVYVPYGGTINELIAEADAALAADPYTPSGHSERAYQEELKNYLDELNNGAGVLSPDPCDFSFN